MKDYLVIPVIFNETLKQMSEEEAGRFMLDLLRVVHTGKYPDSGRTVSGAYIKAIWDAMWNISYGDGTGYEVLLSDMFRKEDE